MRRQRDERRATAPQPAGGEDSKPADRRSDDRPIEVSKTGALAEGGAPVAANAEEVARSKEPRAPRYLDVPYRPKETK
jgi:hypothetical protein